MNCPRCNEPLPQTGLVCPKCGADTAWHILKPDGMAYGPYDLATVDLCIREVRLGPGDMVRIGADGEYQSAQHLLGDRFPQTPPPVTYAPAGYRELGALPTSPAISARACGIAALVFALVVAAIVAASIPVYRQAQGRATQASCMSNLKQIDLALLMYCQDYDEHFPTGNWEPSLDPYLKNRSLWVCPACPHERGYRGNDKLGGREKADVTRLAETLTLWDAGASVPGFPPLSNTTRSRHNGGDNFAYADGHVKWVRQSAKPGIVQVPPPKEKPRKPR